MSFCEAVRIFNICRLVSLGPQMCSSSVCERFLISNHWDGIQSLEIHPLSSILCVGRGTNQRGFGLLSAPIAHTVPCCLTCQLSENQCLCITILQMTQSMFTSKRYPCI